MTNGRRKHGKHSAALPETQPTSARETVAKTGAMMTHRELEEKFATKEELKQSKEFLTERIDHGFQLHSQELRSVETNLSQKIDANEKRAEDFRSDVNRQFEAIEARSVERTNASEARIFDRWNEFKSDVYRQIQTMGKSLESTIEQQSEKNLYKTVFLVVVIGGSLSGLTYGVYQLVKFLIGGS